MVEEWMWTDHGSRVNYQYAGRGSERDLIQCSTPCWLYRVHRATPSTHTDSWNQSRHHVNSEQSVKFVLLFSLHEMYGLHVDYGDVFISLDFWQFGK